MINVSKVSDLMERFKTNQKYGIERIMLQELFLPFKFSPKGNAHNIFHNSKNVEHLYIIVYVTKLPTH